MNLRRSLVSCIFFLFAMSVGVFGFDDHFGSDQSVFVTDAVFNFVVTERFTDNNNGTITDTRTGLIWMKNPGCLQVQDWESARNTARNFPNGPCGITDGSSPGSWHLPTKDEWAGLLLPYQKTPSCTPMIPGKAGSGCCTPAASCAFYGSAAKVLLVRYRDLRHQKSDHRPFGQRQRHGRSEI